MLRCVIDTPSTHRRANPPAKGSLGVALIPASQAMQIPKRAPSLGLVRRLPGGAGPRVVARSTCARKGKIVENEADHIRWSGEKSRRSRRSWQLWLMQRSSFQNPNKQRGVAHFRAASLAVHAPHPSFPRRPPINDARRDSLPSPLGSPRSFAPRRDCPRPRWSKRRSSRRRQARSPRRAPHQLILQ